jgi:L-lactate dehydrogenase complex protein LldE
MIVDLFIPCFIDQMFPETGMNTIKLLKKAGVEVHVNPSQTCCGQFAFNSGFWDEAKKLGEKFMNDFPQERPIVSPSASCAGYVKNYFSELFHNTGSHMEYKRVVRHVVEITDFLVNRLGIFDFGARFEHKVTFQDSCAAHREYGLTGEARILLAQVKGLELFEMPERHVCCGFGGTFAARFEPISVAMTEQKVQNALSTGAEFIVSTDSSCLMQMDSYIRKAQLPIKVIHIVDILTSGW